jgi:hypothetical protein
MAVEDRLDKLDSILGTVNSGYESHARMMAKAQLQEEAFIKKLAQLNKVSEQEIKAKLDLLEAQKKQQKYEEDREKAIAEGIKKVLGGLQQFASGAVSSSQALYTSDAAFTAVIPTMQLLGNAVKSVTGALSSMFSGIPFLGGAIAGLDKLTSVAVDLSLQVGQMMMENSQRLVDNYNNLSKVGANFGGDLEKMRLAAASGGMSIDQFSKFVTKNVESLATMGGTITQASTRVMQMGKAATNSNAKLLAMYGSYEEINSALAGYGEIFARAGTNTVANQRSLEAGSANYLTTLKDLTSLTGMSADQFKKEQEERMKHAAYQAKIEEVRATKGEAAATQLMTQVSIIGKLYGRRFADLAEESIANNGVIISKSGIQLQAFTGGLATQVINPLIQAAQGTKEQWIEGSNKAIKANESTVTQVRSSLTGLSGLVYGTTNESIGMINETASALTASTTLRANFEKARAQVEKDNKETITDGTNSYTQLLQTLQNFKIEMDVITEKNLPKMAEIATKMVQFNANLVEKFGPTFGAAVDKFADVITTLVEKLTGVPTISQTPGEQTANAAYAGAEDELVKANERVELLKKQKASQAEINKAQDELNEANKRAIIADATRRQEQRKAQQARQFLRGQRPDLPAGVNQAPASAPASGPGASAGPNANPYGELQPLLRGQWPGEATGGGEANPRLIEAMKKLIGIQGITIRGINAVNDVWHQKNAPNSKHTKGMAADLNIAEIQNRGTRQATLDAINNILQGIAKAEIHRNAGGAGDHVHLELLKNGGKLGAGEMGIVGEAGAELISGPANVTGVNETARIFSSMIDKLDELVKVNKDQLGGLDKIYRVSA